MKIRLRIKRASRLRYGSMGDTFYLLRSPANAAHLERSIGRVRSVGNGVKFGLLQGQIRVSDDFDAPLPPDIQKYFD